MRLLFLATAVTLAAPAQAAGWLEATPRHASLLAPDDGPYVGSYQAPAEPKLSPHTPRYIAHLGVTFASAFITIPVGQVLASLIGNLSINLIATAIPALLIMGLVAPTLTALSAWLFGNMNFFGRDDKPYPFVVPWLLGTAVHIVALIIGGFAGVSVGVPASLFLFALADGLAMSSVTVGFMHLLQRKPAQAQALPSFVPGVSETTIVPLAVSQF